MHLDHLTAHQLAGALGVHDVDVIFLDVFFQGDSEFRTVGGLQRHEVLDREGVQHLAAEAVGQHA
ncbi:hypothetical protein LTR94_038716, partial [Friedmanniomyces endolithicus]